MTSGPAGAPELAAVLNGPAGGGALSRRELWQALGAGVLLVFTEPGGGAPGGEPLSTRIHVGGDGAFTLLTGKVEIGQGARTELAQVAAEELGVPPDRVRLLMADTALVPDDGGTYGSLTTPMTVPVVRRAAAAARKLLPSLKAGEQLSGTAPAETGAVDPARWKVCGTSPRRANGPDIVTGRHKFAGDLSVPGMLYGKVVRPPAHRAELEEADDAAARRMPGVVVVREGDFLGVAAPGRQTADEAAARIRARWRETELVPAAQLSEHFRKTARDPVPNRNSRYPGLFERGSVEAGMAEAERRLEGVYTIPYIAHVPLEPRAALAEWSGDALTVHCTTQVPFGVRAELAQAFGLPAEKVRVIVPDTGAGFGGKHRGECQLEAARLARAAGKPVLLAWSREEESTCSYARPAALLEVKSGFRKDGRVTAWEFHNFNSGAAGLPAVYAFPNLWIGHHAADSPIRQGSYRSLAAVANAFARETHMDEIAASLSMDPVEFRLRNLEDPRMRAVIERAASRFGWSGRGGGRGAGMAANLEKGGYVALFADLETDGGSVRLRRFVFAMDCGAVINPDNLRNQIAGALIMGIGGALFEELRYDRRGIVNPRLSGYRVPRFSDVPAIEIDVIDRRREPSAGAGESPITVVAPAIGNALFAATGRRLRSLPLAPDQKE